MGKVFKIKFLGLSVEAVKELVILGQRL